jgi:hypothetical protein
MSRSVPPSSWRDANDCASASRNANFKPLVLGEIQAGGDRFDNAAERVAIF